MNEITFSQENVEKLNAILYQAYNAIEEFFDNYKALYYDSELTDDCDDALVQLLDVQSDILDATTAIEESAGLLD